MSGPLTGVKVVEFAGIGPAPFAGMMLADMGAEVTRIDRVPALSNEPVGELDAIFAADEIVGRGRRSIALNLKDPSAVAIAIMLVNRADVLIEGFRPGVAEKLGVGPEAALAANPRLVYGRMTGWGQSGPLSRAAGHDLNYIALSGAAHGIGAPGAPPTVPLNLIGDYGGGGMFLTVGVLAALFEARVSGKGQVVDAAIVDGAAALMAPLYGMLAAGVWRDERGANFIDGAAHFYGSYMCADGQYVCVAAIEPQFYRLLLEKCGVDDSSFDEQWNRSEWPALRAGLARIFLSRTRVQWSELLEGTDACFAPVLSMREAPSHAHNVARGTFVERDGAFEPAPAPRFTRTPSNLPERSGVAGAETAEILKALGFSGEEVTQLVRDAVIHCAAS